VLWTDSSSWAGIERDVGSRQRGPKGLQFGLVSDCEKLEQIAQAAIHGTDAKPKSVVEEFGDTHVGMAHPQTLSNIGYAAAILGMAQAVEDGTFEVADVDRFLFCDPLFGGAENILGL
jgi:hypothetical protein